MSSTEVVRPRARKNAESPAEHRVLPMQLQVGHRLADETGEYEVIGRPYTSNLGKDVHLRVKRVDNTEGHDDSDLGPTRARQRATSRNSLPTC
jgi:hypothetical protein